jgi:hypothetical protein
MRDASSHEPDEAGAPNKESPMRTSFKMMTAAACLGGALTACGGGGDEAEMAKFTGTWSAVSGTTTLSCPDGTIATPVSGQVQWSKGVSTDLVQSSPPCVIDANVLGSTATGTGPACTFDDAAGNTDTLTVTSYTFVVAPDGQTAEENGAGSVLANAPNGATETCTMSETASYQRLSR